VSADAPIDQGGFPGYGEEPVMTVLTVDGVEYSILADPTMAALKAIREIAEHVRPRRGCQEGICGKCESKVDGRDTRLCITPIGTLNGAVVITPAPRKSIWG
jgi:aerobic-type carbon monoxide dehydrogenase small subunit (CoxS/CutS family)